MLMMVCSFALAQNQSNTNNSEPKATFEVTVNGKKYNVSENEDLKLDTLLKPTISIKLSDYKKFKSSAISFDYPRHLSYTFEQDYAYKSWTLSGNSLVVLVFEMDVNTPLTSLVSEMIKKFGKKNCVVEDFEKELGHKMCTGKKINVTLAGQKLVLECFELKLNDFKSHFIYFQDLIENNENSKEYETGFNIINSSIIYN